MLIQSRIASQWSSPLFRVLLLTALLLLLAGCEQATPVQWHGTDLSANTKPRDFSLIDHDGEPRQLADYQGQVVVLSFGFTHCPDICPLTLAELNQAVRMLDAPADAVQVLFVSVDTERDTPELMKAYVPTFNERFIGLTGSPEAIRKTAEVFNVYYSIPEHAPDENYNVDHQAGTFTFDASGRLRLYHGYGTPPAALAEDLARLVAEARAG